MNKKWQIAGSIILGIIFGLIGYVYATHAAEALPRFFPGFQPGDSATHGKHAMASFIVAAAFLIYAWFASGPTQSHQG